MIGLLVTCIIYFRFLLFSYVVIQGVYLFLYHYNYNPYSHIKCRFTKIQSHIAIWQYIASILKHNAQYGIDPYVSLLILNMYSVGYTHRLSFMLLDYVSLIDTKLSNFIYHVQFGNLK